MSLKFQKNAIERQKIIEELAISLNCKDDLDKAARILKSTLHGVRNHLSISEFLQLIVQFSMFLKAIYVDSWKVKTAKNNIKKINDFIDEVKVVNGPSSEKDFPSYEDAENSINGMFLVLRKYIN